MGPGADQGAQARDTFGLVGTTIAGKFRVERVLGEGGFGVVYAGTHVMLGERVAIKCLKPVGFTPEDRERGAQAFLREGRILFGLGHPAIVRLYDVGVIEDGQIPYVVLELLTGTTLAAEIASRAAMRRHFTRDELVELWTPVLEAVAFAHERGIVHRDLKPPNLMLVSEGGRMQPKVLDFGTARSDLVGTGRAAATGAPEASLGKTGFTPLYAAPEQWDAFYGTTGPQTDVYALVAAQPGLESAISITVSPNKTGVVGSVQCSLRVHGTPGEAAFCGCASSAMGKWKFPAARAKLGALEAGPFIYDYRLFPP